MRSCSSRFREIGGAALALLATGACCCGGNYVPATPTPPGTKAVSIWQGFPGYDVPRPILLQGRFMDRQADWSGPGNAAVACHKFTLEPGVSTLAPSQATVTWTDGSSATYPSISARDVFLAMNPTPPSTIGGCATEAPLDVTGARLGFDTFRTDRGPAKMPAWIFSFSVVSDIWSYPAIAVASLWGGGSLIPFSAYAAVLSSNGMSIRVGFLRACDTGYAGVAAESGGAVAVAITTVSYAATSCPRLATRYVDVALKTQLGGRIVVDENANVMVVCPANPKPGSPACYSLQSSGAG